MKEHKLLTLSEFCNTYKLVSYRQMQRFIKDAEKNGAKIWLRRVGKKIFIDVDKFFEWTKV